MRSGMDELPAYCLSQEQHRQFFTSEDMDKRYVDYWNDKLKFFKKNKGRWGILEEAEVWWKANDFDWEIGDKL